MKLYKVFAVCLLCLPLLLYAAPLHARPAPAASLQQIQQALDNRDIALFERRVDVDSLIDQALALLLERVKRSGQNGEALPPALTLMAYSLQDESLAPSIRAMLKKELGSFVRSGVRTGHLNGHPQRDVQPEGMLARFLPEISTGAKTLKATGAPTTQADGGCVLPASLHDAGNGRTYPLQLAMRPQADGWQVCEVRNMPALLRLLEQESKETAQ